MTLHFFAIRVEEHRLVAAEIDAPAAAALLDAAHPLLLGTAENLAEVAQRLRRPLVTIARARARLSAGAARTEPEASHSRPRALAAATVAALPQPKARGLFGIRWGAGRSLDRTTVRVA